MIFAIEDNNYLSFEKRCNQLLEKDYKLSSSSCGYVDTDGRDREPTAYWMAILNKEDKK